MQSKREQEEYQNEISIESIENNHRENERERIVKEKEGGVNDNLSGYFILLFLLYSFSVHCRYFSHISFI